ncbi:uncharacterized protein G2W53_035539 [Senna tora]|uniref:Uncharacterized protein n=1 Tax=Senna tora TaxID=362788 RepID=A0A834SSG0_9FABA|nr:uncharacterized protein G2W53_035539 [Senna tora]
MDKKSGGVTGKLPEGGSSAIGGGNPGKVNTGGCSGPSGPVEEDLMPEKNFLVEAAER